VCLEELKQEDHDDDSRHPCSMGVGEERSQIDCCYWWWHVRNCADGCGHEELAYGQGGFDCDGVEGGEDCD